ncbi:MAG TPA: hypothetical protein VGC54_07635 [Planctomycetota bacterium]
METSGRRSGAEGATATREARVTGAAGTGPPAAPTRRELTGDALLAHGGDALPVAFEVPAMAAATALSARSARYWELELRGFARGADLVARFPLPLYADPAAAPSASGAA